MDAYGLRTEGRHCRPQEGETFREARRVDHMGVFAGQFDDACLSSGVALRTDVSTMTMPMSCSAGTTDQDDAAGIDGQARLPAGRRGIARAASRPLLLPRRSRLSVRSIRSAGAPASPRPAMLLQRVRTCRSRR